MQNVEPDLFSDRINQFALFFQERTFVFRGTFLGVIDIDLTNDIILNLDYRPLIPGSFIKLCRSVDLASKGDHRFAYIRILPASRDLPDQQCTFLIKSRFWIIQQFLNVVKAVEFLSPFF